jgi:hypothetical protein
MEAKKYHWKYSPKNNCQSSGHRYWKCCSAMCNVAKTKTKTLQKLWSEKANQPQAKPENNFPKMQSVILSDDQELQKLNLTESSQNAATNVSSSRSTEQEEGKESGSVYAPRSYWPPACWLEVAVNPRLKQTSPWQKKTSHRCKHHF